MSIDTGFALFSYHVAHDQFVGLATSPGVRDSRARPDFVTEIPLTLEFLLTSLAPDAAEVLRVACRGLEPLAHLSDDDCEYGVVPPANVAAVAVALRSLDIDAIVDGAQALDLEELVDSENLWDVESWTYDPDFDIGEALPHIIGRLRDTFDNAAQHGQAVVLQLSYPV